MGEKSNVVKRPPPEPPPDPPPSTIKSVIFTFQQQHKLKIFSQNRFSTEKKNSEKLDNNSKMSPSPTQIIPYETFEKAVHSNDISKRVNKKDTQELIIRKLFSHRKTTGICNV